MLLGDLGGVVVANMPGANRRQPIPPPIPHPLHDRPGGALHQPRHDIDADSLRQHENRLRLAPHQLIRGFRLVHLKSRPLMLLDHYRFHNRNHTGERRPESNRNHTRPTATTPNSKRSTGRGFRFIPAIGWERQRLEARSGAGGGDEGALCRPPSEQGVPTDFWEVSRLVDWMREHFNVEYGSRSSCHRRFRMADLSFHRPVGVD